MVHRIDKETSAAELKVAWTSHTDPGRLSGVQYRVVVEVSLLEECYDEDDRLIVASAFIQLSHRLITALTKFTEFAGRKAVFYRE